MPVCVRILIFVCSLGIWKGGFICFLSFCFIVFSMDSERLQESVNRLINVLKIEGMMGIGRRF